MTDQFQPLRDALAALEKTPAYSRQRSSAVVELLHKCTHDTIRALLAAVDAKVPPGFVLVPVVPTRAWLKTVAVNSHVWPAHDVDGVPEPFIEAIRAYHNGMIAAARPTDKAEGVTP